MNLYAVVKDGVYRHEIVGVYGSYEFAEKRAVEVCKAESDDYHDFLILQFGLNIDVEDGLLVATISREEGVVSIEAV
jgi:hypothetical protein